MKLQGHSCVCNQIENLDAAALSNEYKRSRYVPILSKAKTLYIVKDMDVGDLMTLFAVNASPVSEIYEWNYIMYSMNVWKLLTLKKSHFAFASNEA